MPDRPRILVVEDDERVASSLRRTLEYEGYQVSVAGDGPQAIAAAQREAPALVVLDVMLPGIDGYGVCRALRAMPGAASEPATGAAMVLMLTARDATADRVTGLDAGADDYLVKPFAYAELLARVRALLRRRPAPPETDHSRDADRLTLGDLVMDTSAHEVTRAGRPVELTAQEFALLRHFLRHPRRVLSRTQLLDAVWGGGNPATTNVVDVYVGYLRTKLEADGAPRLLHTVRGVGYVLRADRHG